MTQNSARPAASAAILGIALVLVAMVGGCSSGMGGDQNRMAGNQKLQGGISTVRAGIKQYQGGDTNGGLAAIHQGRETMGQGMVMMGLGCCMFDGGATTANGAISSCASMMGPGATPAMQGLADFDGAHQTMMATSDPAAHGKAMAEMETAMEMMEQGAGQMMGGMGKGSMGMM